ncbi:hypothetical protein MTR67_003045 [Solanum verrucosum]|uniref:Uncharacterized protein n=1 Tax=Solanum verrucosum TaxID=315347 RepID=A0AAF0PUV4_SOLVR|nr:hypothetical protein MTR67_003045 [Solanum verrucosum]
MVLWRSQSVEGATWEAEASMMAKYPHLFPSDSVSIEVIVPLRSLRLLLCNSISAFCSLNYSCISAYLHVLETQFS